VYHGQPSRFAHCPQSARPYFAVERPNQVWLAGIRYVPTYEGWLYLAAVLDLCTRKIIGCAMRDYTRAELITAALLMAIQRQKPPPGLIHHSDPRQPIRRCRIPQTRQGSWNGPIHEQKRKLLG
jgi:transposase InsO family protein